MLKKRVRKQLLRGWALFRLWLQAAFQKVVKGGRPRVRPLQRGRRRRGDEQQRAQGEQQRLALDQQRENNDMQIDQQRLQQQDQIATERNAVTLAKMNQSGGQNAPRTQ